MNVCTDRASVYFAFKDMMKAKATIKVWRQKTMTGFIKLTQWKCVLIYWNLVSRKVETCAHVHISKPILVDVKRLDMEDQRDLSFDGSFS